MNFKFLLFDLDGTLIDSRDDLADSVNLTLSELNLNNLPSDNIYNFIGEGVYNLIHRSISASLKNESDEKFSNQGVEIFRKFYDENCLNKTKLYEDVAATLAELKGFQKAVITNKPQNFSEKILEALGILENFEFICGGDTFSERKPSAFPLLKTAEKLGFKSEECLMIGDSWVDIEAGKNAKMKTCGCVFGFCGQAELEKSGADYLVENFSELLTMLANN